MAKHDPGMLWNDYKMHLRVMRAFHKHTGDRYTLCLPKVYWFVRGDCADFWDTHLSMFPREFQFPSAIFASDRIPPIPRACRELLIDRFCPRGLRDTAKREPANQDCLIRLYLGRRKRQPQKNSRPQVSFSLRNLPLHLDQLLAIEWDVEIAASEMARALAILHWQAEIDAGDVEFVLGSKAQFSDEFTPLRQRTWTRASRLSIRQAQTLRISFLTVFMFGFSTLTFAIGLPWMLLE
jgi:hypothetical protein